MPARDKAADLTLRETAAALGLSVGTVRQHVKAGRLAASQAVGKYGPEYRLRPAVVAAFGADRYGLELDAADLSKGPAGAGMGEDTRELYERLLRATEEATRYKALNAGDADHYAEEIARERAARIAAEEKLAAELARPWWRRRKAAE
ncbi:MAG TPA: helix-turn-helix domain-containing protein [Candidatus Limnocylindrales bacterium]